MGLFGSAGLKSAASSVAQIVAALVGQNVSMGTLTLTSAAQGILTFSGGGNKTIAFAPAGAADMTYSSGTGIMGTGFGISVNTGNLICRNNSFTQFSVGPSGNSYLNVDSAGFASGIMGTVNQVMNLNGSLTTNVTVVGSGADTTEDDLMTYSLPASTLGSNGRGVRVTAWGDGVSTADVTTVRGYFGATAVLTKVLTASQANTWKAVFEVMRTGAATQIATGVLHNGGTATSFVQANSSPAETLSGAVTIKFTGQRAVSSVANSVRQLGMIIEGIN